jgi:endo-1,3(4)-beta-glucanase
MFPFGNGKSQESSSEAVNGYYGAYLWSVVRNGAAENPALDESPQTDFARLLLATEIRGAKTYWHMMPPKSIHTNQTDSITVYSPQFSENYMVGNLGMFDALCTTWFGNEELYVHMINFLPVTSVTGDLFGSEFVSQEYSKVLKPLGDVEMAWLGYIVGDRAIVDPNSAWVEAEKLFSPTLDSALSKSQLLYWISTRSGFNASAVVVEPSRTPLPSSKGGEGHTDRGSSKAACSSIAACARTGLGGDCCPTLNGVFLDCCSG